VNDDELHEDGSTEPGMIGVGMGGSCPTCRAPVDLGQEFCLECGSPIRFTPRQRSKRRPDRTTAGATGATAARKRTGFPWIPFLIVLALVGAGVALSLVNDTDSKGGSANGTSTQDALPTITNETPTTDTSPSTETVTLEDCDPSRPLDGTLPAVDSSFDDGSFPSDSESSPGDEIPEFDDGLSGPDSGGFDDGFTGDEDVPSIAPSDGAADSATVTVDQNGNICASDDSDEPAGTSTDAPVSGTPGSTTTDSGDWPADRESGWTVIVAGYPGNEPRAQQRAADVQEDGFSDSGVLLSTDFTSLCPGFYVVFSGVFDERADADARLSKLSAKPDYAGMYVREVTTSGTPPSGCTRTS
jgi:hypothetical protein